MLNLTSQILSLCIKTVELLFQKLLNLVPQIVRIVSKMGNLIFHYLELYFLIMPFQFMKYVSKSKSFELLNTCETHRKYKVIQWIIEW